MFDNDVYSPLVGPMLIEPVWFNNFIKTLDKNAFSTQFTVETLTPSKDLGQVEPKVENGLGIVELKGMLFPSKNIYTFLGLGTALDEFRNTLQTLAKNKDVEKILINVNSPGGRVEGTPETAQLVAKVAKSKDIISYVHFQNASGAYWVTSGSTEIYANKMSFVGSIGVVTEVPKLVDNWSVTITNTASPNKRPDPESEEGKKVIQAELDDIADFFIKSVSEGRDVSVETVTNDFGQGGLLIAQKAASAGMIDGVMTFDNVLNKYSTKASNIKSQTNVGGSVMNLEELKAQHPDLVKQIQAEATASINSVNTDLKKALLDMNSKLEASTAAQKETSDRLVALEKENLKNKLIAKTIQVENQTNAIIAASLQKSNIPTSFHKKFEAFIDNADCLDDDMVLDTAKLQAKVDAEIKDFEGLLKSNDSPVAGLTVEDDSVTAADDATVDRLLGFLK